MKNLNFLLLFFLAFYLPSSAQNHQLFLWDKDIPNYRESGEKEQHDFSRNIDWVKKVQNPLIDVFLPTKRTATRQAVIICPGGGYHGLAYDWEGVDVARWLNAKGIAGIVLKYRLPIDSSNIVPHESPLMDAKRAIRMVRHHAKEWNIDSEKIGVMGFSAGGHLASTLGTHFDYGNKHASDPIEQLSSRPDFMTLVYPVISTTEAYMHKGSKNALLGKNPSEELVEFYSNELQIGYDAPPTFLIHAGDDKSVPIENSLVFYQNLKDKKIPVEMHIYPEGGHAFGLGIGKGYLATWPDRLADWLKDLNKNNPDEEVWQPMFNGKDFTGWDIHIAGHELNDNYKNTFQIEGNQVRIKYDEYEQFDEKYGHMYYEKPMEYYKFRFDYRFTGEQTKGGATWNVRNSGIMFHSQSAASLGKEQHFPVSVELQLLGGLGDNKDRTTANICTPGTYFEIDGKPIKDHCYSSSSKTYHGDQWVNVEAIILGDSLLIHIVEGDTVMVYEHPRLDEFYISPNNNPLNWETAHVGDAENFIQQKDKLLTGGYIALQAESHPIDFKNVELLNLKGCMDPKAENYKSYYLKDDKENCKYK